jgi:hypothetical protein
VRFAGRRVYLAVVLILVSPPGSSSGRRLCELCSIPARTLKRWRAWWREDFPSTPFWQSVRELFMRPVRTAQLPQGLLERFDAGALADRLVQALRFIAPLSTGTIGFKPAATDNLGLVIPPQPLDWNAVSRGAPGDAAPGLAGAWVVLVPLPDFCDDDCRERVHGLRQVHRAAGRRAGVSASRRFPRNGRGATWPRNCALSIRSCTSSTARMSNSLPPCNALPPVRRHRRYTWSTQWGIL